MYRLVKSFVLSLLAAPEKPPDTPPGATEETETFRASKKYLGYQLFVRLVIPVFMVAIAAFGLVAANNGIFAPESKLAFTLFGAIGLVSGLGNYILARVDYDMRYYVVTDRSLRIREGAWQIDESTFTFANVQNLSIKQGPIANMLGIADLVVHTAGGGDEGAFANSSDRATNGQRNVLRGIENAQQVRDQIQRRVKEYRDAGLGDENEDLRRPDETPDVRRFSDRTVGLLRDIRDEVVELGDVL